jgi:hypothetical protein
MVVCVGVISTSTAQAQWTEAKIPNEQERTAQGCAAETREPGDWVCVLVRCDQPGSPPSLYFSSPKPEIRGNIKLVIDENSFELSVREPASSPLPFSTRVDTIPGNMLEAMKSGKTLSIENAGVKPPHNRISMQNSRKAIERMEWACTKPPTAARLWRRVTRAVGIH